MESVPRAAAAGDGAVAVPPSREPWLFEPPASARAAMPAWAVCVDEHAKAAALGGGLRDGASLVHVVRDPLEVCISAYQYALRSTESWLHVGKAELGGRSYQQYYRASSVETGLAVECRRSMKELRQMAELYQATRRAGAVLTLRFEDIEAGFDDAMRKVFAFAGAARDSAAPRDVDRMRLLLTAAARHDLGRSARDLGAHVSNASQKAPLRAMLQRPGDALAGELRRLRRDLDYPVETEVGSGVVVDGALRRRWLLATTAKVAG